MKNFIFSFVVVGMFIHGVKAQTNQSYNTRNQKKSKSIIGKTQTSSQDTAPETKQLPDSTNPLVLKEVKEKLVEDIRIEKKNRKALTKTDSNYLLKLSKLSEKIEEKKSELNRCKDSLAKYQLLNKRINIGFSPSKAKAFFRFAYSENESTFSAVRNAGLTWGNNTVALNTTLFSGHVGAVRMSFGALISSSSEKEELEGIQDESLQKLVNYGGNSILLIEHPVLYIHSDRYLFNFISRATVRPALDIPGFGTFTKDFALNISSGIDNYIELGTDNEQLKLFGTFSFNGYYCNNQSKVNLGVSKNYFILMQSSIGIMIMKNVKFSILLPILSSAPQLRKTQIVAGGGQVLRGED